MAKMQAVVIRTVGDPAISGQIVRGLEARELEIIKGELKMLRRRDNAAWLRKLEDIQRKYRHATKTHSRFYKAFWGIVGMIILLHKEARE